jgi:microcystin-dependent protein
VFAWGATPAGWVACDGRLLPIAQNQPLFSVIGTTYGGDGQSTFAVPDLRGRGPLGAGPRVSAGQRGGEEAHTLTTAEAPAHHHALQASPAAATTSAPGDGVLAAAPVWGLPTDITPLQAATVGSAGGSHPHPNMQPYLALNICIALQGNSPST